MCHAIKVKKQNRCDSHAHSSVPEAITVSSTALTCQKVRRQILMHQVLALIDPRTRKGVFQGLDLFSGCEMRQQGDQALVGWLEIQKVLVNFSRNRSRHVDGLRSRWGLDMEDPKP